MNFRLHARTQAAACESLGSPLMARILRLVAEKLAPGTPVADRLFGWPPDRLNPDAVALRLAGALHHLVLTGAAPDLEQVYATPAPVTDTAFWHAIEGALSAHAPAVLETMERAPQTNDVRRSSVLIAAAHWLTAVYRKPFVLSELGSSAGLNLIWDDYGMAIQGHSFGAANPVLTLTPEWRGALPPQTAPTVLARAGVDLNPLDPEHDRLRILSYIWPDQTERMARTRQALTIAAERRVAIDRANAIDWLENRLALSMPGAVHFVFHTITWQYLSPEDQARGDALIARSGTCRSGNQPLAHLAMEQDQSSPGAAVTLKLWPANQKIILGRADFHGRWVEWSAPEVP